MEGRGTRLDVGGRKTSMKWLQNIAWNIDVYVCVCKGIDREREGESQLDQKNENENLAVTCGL